MAPNLPVNSPKAEMLVYTSMEIFFRLTKDLWTLSFFPPLQVICYISGYFCTTLDGLAIVSALSARFRQVRVFLSGYTEYDTTPPSALEVQRHWFFFFFRGVRQPTSLSSNVITSHKHHCGVQNSLRTISPRRSCRFPNSRGRMWRSDETDQGAALPGINKVTAARLLCSCLSILC